MTRHVSESILSILIRDNNHKLITCLIEKFPELIVNYGSIVYAAAVGNLSIIKLLVDYGANVRIDNDSAVEHACSDGHLDVVIYLVNAGASIENDNCLVKASVNGHLHVVKFLLATATYMKHSINWALMCTAEKGHFDVVEYFIKSKLCDHDSVMLAMDYAARQGKTHVVKFIIEHEQIINPDSDRTYGILWACKKGYFDIVELMCKSGINFRINNDDCLKFASESGHLSIVKYLVGLGADVRADNDYCIREAAKNGHTHVVDFLIECVLMRVF